MRPKFERNGQKTWVVSRTGKIEEKMTKTSIFRVGG